MLPLFPVAAVYRLWRGSRDPRGDGLRRLIARWVSIYGETTPLYRFDVQGRSRLPTEGPYVLVANHESGLDVLCLLMLRTPARFVAEDFLFAIPLAGWLFRASEQIPVKIGDRESGRRALARAAEALDAGTPVAFFPEGRLSPDEMIAFKPGAFVCAQRAGVPIVPVLIEGAGNAWRPGTMVVRGRHVIRMHVLEPIEPAAHGDTNPEVLAASVRQRLLDARAPVARAGARRSTAALALLATMLGCATAQRPYDVPAEERLTAVDDRAWDAELAAHVDEGRVEYAAFCDAPALSSYLADVERVDLGGATEAERMALYLNAYNALSIRAILRGQSPSTLLGRYGFFVRERARVAGAEMSLLTLERRVIVPMGDPRIHFALVCASASCPWLRAGVYGASDLEGQLEDAARRFVNDPSKNRFDVAEGRAEVSAIFDWYRDEFAEDAGSLEAYLARYVRDDEVAAALGDGRIEIDFLDYDWSLNGSPPGPNGRCPEVED
jgi:1-acyl-sn-glycerol-3-phosphate acyltransferase